MRTSFTIDLKSIWERIKHRAKSLGQTINKYIPLGVLAAVLIAILAWNFLITPVFFPQQTEGVTIGNIGKLSTSEGLGIYWDVTATNPATQIDWGVISLDSARVVKLTFAGYDVDIAEELQIWVNNQLFYVYPPEYNGANNNAWKDFDIDISNVTLTGPNSILFRGSGGGSGCTLTNITITQDTDSILLNETSSISILDTTNTYETTFTTTPASYDGYASAVLYIRNEGETPLNATMFDHSWNPSNLSIHTTLSWDFGPTPRGINRVRKIIFLLEIDKNLPDGFNEFTFEITVTRN